MITQISMEIVLSCANDYLSIIDIATTTRNDHHTIQLANTTNDLTPYCKC